MNPENPARLLVVEDEAIIARDIVRQLTLLGYRVLGQTARGDEAVHLAETLWPDLVLMDVQLDGPIDGIEAAKRIRERTGIPAVFLTAFAGSPVLQRAKESEPYGYLVKPFEPQQLATAVEIALHQHKVEARLRESREELAAILRTAMDAFWVTDTDTRFLDVNEAACALYGYTREEMLRMSIRDVEVDETATEIAAFTRELLRRGSARFERRHRCKDGRVINVEVSLNHLPNADGRFFCFVRDVTGRKQAEAEIARQRNELAAIYDHAPFVLCELDDGLRVVRANRAALAFADRAEADLVGRGPGHILGCVYLGESGRGCGGGLECAECPLHRMIGETLRAGGSLNGVELRRPLLRDGRLREHLLRVHAARIEFEGVGRVLLCVEDLTERHRAESLLRASEAKFATMFRAAPVIILLTALPDGRIVEVNDAFLRTSEFTREEVVGRTAVEFGWITVEERQELLDRLRRDGRVQGLQIVTRTKSGRAFECLYNGEIVEVDGQPCILSMLIDTTERSRLEQQLRQLQKMESIGQLAGGVAHDFNNILSAILMHLGLLRHEAALDEDTLATVRELEREASRAAGLTRQLLAFSRRQVMQVRAVQLSQVVTDLVRMLRRLLGETIALSVEGTGSLPLIWADPGMVEQVVINLCVNARDAMPRGGRITLRMEEAHVGEQSQAANPERRRGRFVRLGVRDTGSGMTDEVRQRLFEPFFTTKEAGKGTGLGLATVYGIVKQHGGWIEVESAVGHGSRFEVYLPVAAAHEELEPAAPAAKAPGGRGETVLVVEDEAGLRVALAITLRRVGYRVLEAPHGLEAIRLWQAHRAEISLLFTDLVLPNGLMGGELAERFRAEKPGLCVVYTSGYSSGERLASGPGIAVLPKPYETDQALNVVRRLLDAAASGAAAGTPGGPARGGPAVPSHPPA